MDRSTATRILGVAPEASWIEIRTAFRAGMREHHPDLSAGDGALAASMIAAYRFLDEQQRTPGAATTAPPPTASASAAAAPTMPEADWAGTACVRLAPDTLAITAPADETFRLLLDAAHDIGEVTYLDRSVPIVEVLCSFVDEPATSLVLTLQGRSDHTEIFCTVESIEARPAPPTEAVVDLLTDAIHTRL